MPSADSDIKIEVWMPTTNWNGKFQAVGNGGWAGTISYISPGAAAANGGLGGMAGAVQNGYAAASTDTGHAGQGAEFALGHREKLIDYAYRAVHEMTVTSKAIVSAFYGRPANLSYFNGCSTGGRQALVEAERYPEDFDGILECKGGDGPQCLTKPQVAAAMTVMAPAKSRSTGALMFPGYEPGNELGWGQLLKGPDPYDTALDDFKYVIFANPNWDWRKFDLERDVPLADEATQGTIQAVNPNLSKLPNMAANF